MSLTGKNANEFYAKTSVTGLTEKKVDLALGELRTIATKAIDYKGTWDATANTPTLASGVGNQGDYYVVSVEGTTTLDGISDWYVGDWAVFNGTVWEQVDNSEIFVQDGTDVKTVDPALNIDLQDGGLKDTNVTTAVKFGSVTQTSLDTTDKTLLGGINELYLNKAITKESTGFTDPGDVIVTGNADRTVTLTGTVNAYYRGILNTDLVTGYISPVHDNTITKSYVLLYDGSTISWVDVSTLGEDFFSDLLIAIAFYNSTDSEWSYVRECHGLEPWQTHKNLHDTVGTYRKSGGTFSGYTLASTTAADRRPLISEALIYDEDLPSTIPELATETYTQFYLNGAAGELNFIDAADDIVPLNTANPYYNQFTGGAWQQTLMSNNYYMAVWTLMLPSALGASSQKLRHLFVQGQQISSSLADIQALTPSDVNLGLLNSSTPELVFTTKTILRYLGGNWTLIEVNDLTGTKLSQSQSPTGNYLSSVSTDVSLTGTGVTGDSLGIDLTNSNTFTADQSLGNAGASTNSYKKIFVADNSGTLQYSSIQGIFGADPYLRISAPHETGGAETPVVDIHRTKIAMVTDSLVDLGATASGRLKDIFISGIFTGANATLTALNTAGGIVQTDASGVLSTSVNLPTATTIGSAYIYRAGGADVAVADGGTNISSYTTGDLLYASDATTLSKLSDVAFGSVLVSGGIGAIPVWSSTPTLTNLILTGASLSSAAATALSLYMGATLGYQIETTGSQNVYIPNAGTYTINATDAGVLQVTNGTVSGQISVTNSSGGFVRIGSNSAKNVVYGANSGNHMTINTAGNILIGDFGNAETKLELQATAPHFTRHNTTETNDLDGRAIYDAYRMEKADTSQFIGAKWIYAHETDGDDDQTTYAKLYLNTGSQNESPSEALGISSSGNMIFNAAVENGNLTHGIIMKNGTAASAAVIDGIQIHAEDTSDSTSSLALYLEQAVEDVGTFTATKKIKIMINSVEYWIQLDAV